MSEEQRYVGTREAAQLLDVGESTVKRWVDLGVLPAARTLGKHRKIRLADLERVARDRKLPLAGLEQAQAIDVPALAEALYQALAVGDAVEAQALLRRAHDAGLRVAGLGDRLVAPAMARLGHGWASSELDVYQEHRATQACLSALQSLRSRLPATEAGAPLAIGGGPEGDHSVLANLLVELTLREEGWDVQHIGPHTPFPSLCRAVREQRPRLAWLSCTHLADPEAFLAGFRLLASEAAATGTVLILGGQALTDDLLARIPPVELPGDLTTAALQFSMLKSQCSKDSQEAPLPSNIGT